MRATHAAFGAAHRFARLPEGLVALLQVGDLRDAGMRRRCACRRALRPAMRAQVRPQHAQQA